LSVIAATFRPSLAMPLTALSATHCDYDRLNTRPRIESMRYFILPRASTSQSVPLRPGKPGRFQRTHKLRAAAGHALPSRHITSELCLLLWLSRHYFGRSAGTE